MLIIILGGFQNNTWLMSKMTWRSLSQSPVQPSLLPDESLSPSLHLSHSVFSLLPSAPQHLQCSTELSATASMPIENHSTISLLPSRSDFHQLPKLLSISQNSTVRFTSQEPFGCMFLCYIFLVFLVEYVIQWHLVSGIADSAVSVFIGVLRRKLLESYFSVTLT